MQTALLRIILYKKLIIYHLKLKAKDIPLQHLIFLIFPHYWTYSLKLRFMQHLEDALNVSVCGHLLIALAAMCFAAFSTVTVQYNNCSILLHYKIVNYEMW